MHTDDTRPVSDRRDTGCGHEPRDGVFARVQAAAHEFVARVRKVLGRDDDTRPPGFNGLMLVA